MSADSSSGVRPDKPPPLHKANPPRRMSILDVPTSGWNADSALRFSSPSLESADDYLLLRGHLLIAHESSNES